MKAKTAGFTLSALFLSVVLGAGAIREQKKEFALRQQHFMDCFTTAWEAHYPSRATPEERANAQKKTEEITRIAHASVGIKLTGEQIQTTSMHLTDSQIVIDHCAAKTEVRIEGRWTSGDRSLPSLK